MRRLVALCLGVALASSAAPAGALTGPGQGSCVSALDICVSFSLVTSDQIPGDGVQWAFTTTITGPGFSGPSSSGAKLLAVGLYATSGSWNTTANPIVTIDPNSWDPFYQPEGAAISQLGAFAGSGTTSVFELGAKHGVETQTVIITFNAPSDVSSTNLIAAAHVGSFENTVGNCSLFFGSEGNTNILTKGAECGGSTVPEPVSLVLLGSGLLGLGGLRLRRRNRQ